jgi:hypothetical protein
LKRFLLQNGLLPIHVALRYQQHVTAAKLQAIERGVTRVMPCALHSPVPRPHQMHYSLPCLEFDESSAVMRPPWQTDTTAADHVCSCDYCVAESFSTTWSQTFGSVSVSVATYDWLTEVGCDCFARCSVCAAWPCPKVDQHYFSGCFDSPRSMLTARTRSSSYTIHAPTVINCSLPVHWKRLRNL